MPINERLRNRYSDLLNEDHDCALLQVVTHLDSIADSLQLPPSLPRTFDAILTRRSAPPAKRLQKLVAILRGLPRSVVIPTALLLVLLISVAMPVAAYQSIPFIQRVFGADVGLRHVVSNKLGHNLNFSQSIAGYSVTLHWAYADTNRVVVAYSVQQPDGQSLQRRVLSDSSLRDSTGRLLTFLGGPENLNGEYLESFDAAGATAHHGELELHLVIPLFAALLQRDIADPQATSVVVPKAGSRSFVFSFTIPEAGGVATSSRVASRELHVAQTVTVGGQPLTLERVVLTSSETRLYLIGRANGTVPGPMPILTAAGWNSEQPSTWTPGAPADARSWTSSDGQTVISFLAYLADKHGPWSLTVNHPVPMGGVQTMPEGASQPWVFRFYLP